MNPISRLRQAVEQASKNWIGINWDSGPQNLARILSILDNVLDARYAVEEAHGLWVPNDGEMLHQKIHAAWRNLCYDVCHAEVVGDDFYNRAKFIADAEAKYVAKQAMIAKNYGEIAVEYAEDGDWESAIIELQKACVVEREFGDDPTWGPVLLLANDLAPAKLAEAV